MINGANYVNGKFITGTDFTSLNPSNELPIGIFPAGGKEEVDEAVAVATAALPAWRGLGRVRRAEYFDRLAYVLLARLKDAENIISLETGKNLNESYAEAMEAVHMAQYCFGRGRERCGDMIASEIPDRDSYVIRKPKGVVGVISPWNFPLAIGGFWCAAPALLEGNTVVCKPSELTPAVGQFTAELYDAAGFPPGVFNMVHGDGETGKLLVQANVNHICFTGSAETGQLIRKACADTWGKTCSCEMGSKSAVMVFSDADMDLAASACLNSAFKLSGQRCVSAGRLLVQRDVFGKFMDKFMPRVREAKTSDPFTAPPGFSFGPLISEEQMKRVQGFNQMVRDHGAAVECDGPAARPGYFLSPFVYVTEWADLPFLKQEVFGPHVAVIPFDTLDDAIRIYNDTDYGLSLGAITNDYRRMREIRERCDAGMIYFNLGSIGAESHLPFGGVKKSGFGGSSAAGTFDTVVNKVAVTVNHANEINFPQGLK